LGEMEHDSFVSHGVADILRERLMLVSDAYRMIICTQCGGIADVVFAKGTANCRVCRDDLPHYGVIMIPYALKYLMYLLNGVYIQIVFHTVPTPAHQLDS
jgi:DNA-directed RNA polymerase II subunit RPB2